VPAVLECSHDREVALKNIGEGESDLCLQFSVFHGWFMNVWKVGKNRRNLTEVNRQERFWVLTWGNRNLFTDADRKD